MCCKNPGEEAQPIFLQNWEEAVAVSVLTQDIVKLSSWQIHWCLILLSLGQVHKGTVKYKKPTASLINNPRNIHTQNAFIQLPVSFSIIHVFRGKQEYEPQELTLHKKKKSEKRYTALSKALPFSVGEGDIFDIR